MGLNHTQKTSFAMQNIEIDVLYEQLKKLQTENEKLMFAIKFLQGEIVGKSLNANHPYYHYYIEIVDQLKK